MGQFASSRHAVGRASGKLLLFGEHAAVYGYPAVGTALPLYTTVTVRLPAGSTATTVFPGTENQQDWKQLEIDCTTIDEEDRPAVEAVLKRLFRTLSDEEMSSGNRAARKLLQPREPAERQGTRRRQGDGPAGGTLSISSSVPRGMGLGSSAALCAALAAAALPEAPSLRRWRVANELEREFHGTPSGVDTGLATLGGAHAFQFGQGDLPRQTPIILPEGALLAGAVRREGSTRTLIAGLKARIEAAELEPQGALAGLGTLSAAVAETLTAGTGRPTRAATIAELGGYADRAHEMLAGWGLSTVLLDRVLECGRVNGATGGKLSGAGGGGAFFLLFPNLPAAKGACAAIRALLREASPGATLPDPPLLVLDTAEINAAGSSHAGVYAVTNDTPSSPARSPAERDR